MQEILSNTAFNFHQIEGFKHAKYLLEKVYGNPYKILTSCQKEVKNWQPIKFGDVIAFRRFHNSLLRCKNVAKNKDGTH